MHLWLLLLRSVYIRYPLIASVFFFFVTLFVRLFFLSSSSAFSASSGSSAASTSSSSISSFSSSLSSYYPSPPPLISLSIYLSLSLSLSRSPHIRLAQTIGQLRPEEVLLSAIRVLQDKLDMVQRNMAVAEAAADGGQEDADPYMM